MQIAIRSYSLHHTLISLLCHSKVCIHTIQNYTRHVNHKSYCKTHFRWAFWAVTGKNLIIALSVPGFRWNWLALVPNNSLDNTQHTVIIQKDGKYKSIHICSTTQPTWNRFGAPMSGTICAQLNTHHHGHSTKRSNATDSCAKNTSRFCDQVHW